MDKSTDTPRISKLEAYKELHHPKQNISASGIWFMNFKKRRKRR